MTSTKQTVSPTAKPSYKSDKQDLKTRIQNILSGGSLGVGGLSTNVYSSQVSQSAKQREPSPSLKLGEVFDDDEQQNRRPPKQSNMRRANEYVIGSLNEKQQQQNTHLRNSQSKEDQVYSTQQAKANKQPANINSHISPDRPPLQMQSQPEPQTLQRLLSEESQKEKMLSYKMKDMQRVGFQENLNKKVNNQAGKTVGGILNKGALNSLTYHDSSSTKYNSYLVKSFWLLTSVKSKKMQEIVQNRQKTCQFCSNNHINNSSGPLPNSHLHTADHYKNLVRSTLDKKYLTSQDYYNSKIVGDIMYNENRHIVSVFKDYLIFDDFSEYLKRFYKDVEALERLPKVFDFYEKYSKVFPNYVVLPENKYMFKNIERKQKLIDEKHQQQLEKQDRLKKEEEEALAAGMASSFVQRMKQSKNQIFGSQFLNNLTELDNTQSLLRQQSSKIIDMLAMQHNIPYGNQMMNDFIKQTSSGSRNNEVLKFENLIQKLIQNDKHDDQIKGSVWNYNIDSNNMLGLPELDLSMSSQAMSSFLHDFDLTKANNVHTLVAAMDDSHFCAETPLNRSVTSNDIKKGIKGQNQFGRITAPSREKMLVNIDLGASLQSQQNPFTYQNNHSYSVNSNKGSIVQQSQNSNGNQVWSSIGDSKKLGIGKKVSTVKKDPTRLSANPQVNAITKALLQQPSQTPVIQKKKQPAAQFQLGNQSPSSEIVGIAFKERKLQDSMHHQQLSNSSLRSGQSQNQVMMGRGSQISIANSASISSVQQLGSQISNTKMQNHQKHTPQQNTNLKSISLIKQEHQVNYRNTGSALDHHTSIGGQKKGSISGQSNKMMSTQQYTVIPNRSSLGSTQKYDSSSFASKMGQSPMPTRQSPCIDIISGKHQRSSQDSALMQKAKIDLKKQKDESVSSYSFKSNLSNNVVSPTSTNSIKEAVNKLLPPQPQTQKITKAKAIRLESSTPTPQSVGLGQMTTTTALLNKYLDTQQQIQQQQINGKIASKNIQPVISIIGGNLKIETPTIDEGINKGVYSTRGPQKKNFSSPYEEMKKGSLKPKSNDYLYQNTQSEQQLTRKNNNFVTPHINSNEIQTTYQYLNSISYEINTPQSSSSTLQSQQALTSLKKGPRGKQTETFVDSLSPSTFSRDLQSNSNFAPSKSVEPKERSGSEKIVDGKGVAKDLFIIPEMIYSIKGAQQVGAYSTKAEVGRRVETSIGIAKTTSLSQQKQKRNPSLVSENSAHSQKSNYSTTSNPYQRATTTMTQNSNSAINNSNNGKKKPKVKSNQVSAGASSQAGDLKSTQLYEKIKNANSKKKQLATIFTFNK